MLLAFVSRAFAPKPIKRLFFHPVGAQSPQRDSVALGTWYLNKPLAVCICVSGLVAPWEGSPQREDTQSEGLSPFAVPSNVLLTCTASTVHVSAQSYHQHLDSL